MHRIYLDSSAYVKIFKREMGSKLAKQLVSLAENNRIRIFLSYWVINETIAAIDKTHIQRGEIKNTRKEIIIATILKKLIDYSESNIVVIPLNHRFARDSVSYIYKFNISADDALHVFVAVKNNCEYFICKDNRLKQNIDNKIGKLHVVDITSKKEMDRLFKQFSA
jgi:predicted nucleic acid-binding protein